MARPRVLSEAKRRAVVIMYRNTSALKTGRHHGVDHQSVLNIVREAGEPVRGQGKNIRHGAVA